MRLEEDYLMRQLKMLFDVLQKIIGHRKKGEKRAAMEQINHFYTSLKLEADVRDKSIEALMELLIDKKKLTNQHLEMVAIALKEQGTLEERPEQKKAFFRKAWFILEKVERESTTFSMDRQMKLAELREYLSL